MALLQIKTYKIFLTLIVLLLFGRSSNGQDNAFWSTPQKITNKTYYTNLVGQNQKGVYIFQTAKNERERYILITSLNRDLSLSSRREFLQNKYERMEKLVLFQTKIALIYSVQHKKSDSARLMVKMLDHELNTLSPPRIIHSFINKDSKDDLVTVIPDRARKEVLISIASHGDSLHNNLSLFLYDDQFRLLKSDRLDIPPQAESFELARHRLVNKNYISVLSYYKKEGLFKRVKLKMLLKKDLSTGQLNQYALFNDSLITDKGKFSYDTKAHTFNFSSFYYKADSMQPSGFFQYHLSCTSDSTSHRIMPFQNVYLDELFGRNRDKKSTQTLYFNQAVKRSDGGDIFICERKEIDEQHMDEVSVYGVQQSYIRYYFYYYEISILSVNPDGTLDWHKMIKKEQISLNDEGYYSSFGCQVSEDRLYFIYNEISRKNKNVLVYEVNPNGEGEGSVLISGSTIGGTAIPKESMQMSSQELIIPVLKDREGLTLLKLVR